MLRGCSTSLATGFLYTFTPLIALGIVIVLAFKIAIALNAITNANKQPVLPTAVQDLGNSSAICRSPSDSTIAKRYMAARAPPVSGFRSPPVTPSSELSSPVAWQEEFVLRLPGEATPPSHPQAV